VVAVFTSFLAVALWRVVMLVVFALVSRRFVRLACAAHGGCCRRLGAGLVICEGEFTLDATF